MAVDEKSLCCLFCYRLFNTEKVIDVSVVSQTQFLQLLKRYFQNDSTSCEASAMSWVDSVYKSISSSKMLGEITSPCLECSPILKSICKYFEEMEVLQMKLQWRLKALVDIVESSEKAKRRRKLFQVKLEQVKKELDAGVDVGDLVENVKCFRTELVKTCTQRFKTTSPRVILSKVNLDSSQRNELERVARKRTRSIKNVIGDNDKRRSKRFKSGPRPGPRSAKLRSPRARIRRGKHLKENDAVEHFSEENGVDEDEAFIKTEPQSQSEDVGAALISDVDIDETFEDIMSSNNKDSFGKELLNSGMISKSEPISENEDADDFRYNGDSDGDEEEALLQTILEKKRKYKSDYEKKRIRPIIQYDFMQNLFNCPQDNCTSFFYNQADLDNHSRLHGHFRCSLCDQTFSYAPLLALHELRHSLLDETQTTENKICPRDKCLYHLFEDKNQPQYIAHFLKVHLDLLPNMHTCHICKNQDLADDCWKFDLKPTCRTASVHFKKYHDYNRKGLPLKNPDLQCDVPECPAYFLKATQLKMHKMRVHRPEKPKYKPPICRTCSAQFTTYYELGQHNLNMHGDKYGVVCTVQGCNQRFRKHHNLQSHLERDHREERLKCSICNRIYYSKGDLIFHQNQVHGRIILQDANSFFPPDDGDDIEEPDSPVGSFRCPEDACPEVFFNGEDLEGHFKLHGIFPCQFCEETRTYAPDLAMHEASSHGKGKDVRDKIACARCDSKHIWTEMEYVQHHLHHHLKLEAVVASRCSICRIILKTDNFRRNFKMHFKSYHDIDIDLDLGVGGVKYRCQEEGCGRGDRDVYFRHIHQLRRHSSFFHCRSKKMKNCEYCGENFDTVKELREHKLNKHGEIEKEMKEKDPFRFCCDQCGRQCRSLSELKEHQRRHGQEKTYACEYCGKMFWLRNALGQHLKKEHGHVWKRLLQKQNESKECKGNDDDDGGNDNEEQKFDVDLLFQTSTSQL